MTGTPQSAAHAMTPATARTTWTDLPDQVRTAVEARTGAVHQATTISSGLNAAFTAQLRTHAGPVFAKGVPSARAAAQRREATINPHVHPIAPRLLWEIDTDGWHILGFEHLDGRPADLSPTSADLAALAIVLTQLGDLTAPHSTCKRIETRWADAADRAGADASLLAGDHLLHTDLNPHNILITGTGPRIVDWSWPTLGAPWIDTACATLWLIAEGHTPADAEAWATGVPACADAPEPARDAFAAINAALWGHIAMADSRQWKKHIHHAAVTWATFRARR